MHDIDAAALAVAVEPLVREGTRLLASEGFAQPGQYQIDIYAHVKYAGQTSPLPVLVSPLPICEDTLRKIAERFEHEHLRTFGYASDNEPLQFVSLKAVCRGIPAIARMPESLRRAVDKTLEDTRRKAYFGPDHGWLETPVLTRSVLAAAPVPGPAILEEYDTTTVVRPGWTASLDAFNNVVLTRDHIPGAEDPASTGQ
jgi:N-methylhydantoinase A